MMKRPLTKRQKETLEILKTYQKEHDKFPTRRELAKILDCTLSNTQRIIDGLVKAKALFRLPSTGNNQFNGQTLSFEPFDRELVLMLQAEAEGYKKKEPENSVTVFLSEDGKFLRHTFTGQVRLLIKREKAPNG